MICSVASYASVQYERPRGMRFRHTTRPVCLAGEQGLEPQLPDPESGVLPLNYSPKCKWFALTQRTTLRGAEGEI